MKNKPLSVTGTYQTVGSLNFFIPSPLPPTDPPFELSSELVGLYGEATFRLGQLQEMSRKLPDPTRFLKAYVIKEALLSSEIEGIHTTLLDVFTHTIGETKASKNTMLVLNYTESLDVALDMIQNKKLPLSSRVILAAHDALMRGEESATPGSYRKQSVRVGDLIPPPSQEIQKLMGALEDYINEPLGLPLLIKAGLVHVQFETIHPFLDGNGRIGRLLIILMLLKGGLLDMPILYPSYYFKKHRLEYYQLLDRVRTQGDFEGWITFYLRAMRDSALDGCLRAEEIEDLEQKLKGVILTDPLFSKQRETALNALNLLFSQPVLDTVQLSKGIDKAYNTAHSILQRFVRLGWVSETIIHKRNRQYRFEPYLILLEKEYT
jgi:Fic family protein